MSVLRKLELLISLLVVILVELNLSDEDLEELEVDDLISQLEGLIKKSVPGLKCE